MRELATEQTPLVTTGVAVGSGDDDEQTTISSASAGRRTRITAIVSVLLGVLTVLAVLPAIRQTPQRKSVEEVQEERSDLSLLGNMHTVGPCDQIMVGVWTKTCLVHVGMNTDHLESEGMVSYVYVTLTDGSFAEIQNDGNGFMSMYGSYNYVQGTSASRTQNCLAKYTSYYKQDPIDNWLPAPGSFTYNSWEFGKDFSSNIPNSLSCHFDRIKGQDCRTLLARLLSHLAGDGVSLSQYWNAARDLC